LAGEPADDVGAKLDAIIRLLARICVQGGNKNESILTLGKLGLDRDLIAAVCDTTPGTVSTRLSEARRGAKTPTRGREASVG
jgi:hypothetical protein